MKYRVGDEYEIVGLGRKDIHFVDRRLFTGAKCRLKELYHIAENTEGIEGILYLGYDSLENVEVKRAYGSFVHVTDFYLKPLVEFDEWI